MRWEGTALRTFKEREEGVKQLKIAVVGLGYVGLPLALLFLKKGFDVIGIDSDQGKIDKLHAGLSYLPDLDEAVIRSANSSRRFIATDDYDAIISADSIVICVPTPLNDKGNPDLSYLLQAGKEISLRIKRGQLVILESSTYPGTTREVLQHSLEKSGLEVGVDIYLGYSPERIDPGNTQYLIENIVKVVSGITADCTRRVYELYTQIFAQVAVVSSTEAAELTKILENSYRFVNISFINEFAMLCNSMNLNVWEIIDAARTKPFGFTAFYPGPGIGGHCIPVDPLYLQWKVNQFGLESKFIAIANKVNQEMPQYIVKQIKLHLALSKARKPMNVLMYGIAYKRNIDDVRESGAIEIIKLLQSEGMAVSYHDSYVPSVRINNQLMFSVELTDEALQKSDCVVIVTDHSDSPIQQIMDHASIVFDTRNATKGMKGKAQVFLLGGGR